MTRLWEDTPRAALTRAAQAAFGQVVLAAGSDRDESVLGPDGGQHRQVALDLTPHPAERDAEYALAAREQIHHLIGGRALVHADSVAHQRHLGQVGTAAIAQVLDRGPDLLERDARVEQPLDDLQHEDVAEAVQPLRAGPVGGTDARFDQRGAGPVVELAVGDAGRGACGRPAVADLTLVPARVTGQDSVTGEAGNLVVVEQGALRAADVRNLNAVSAVITPGYRHAHLHGT